VQKLVVVAPLALVCLPAGLAAAAPAPATLRGFTAWAAADARVGFVAASASGRRGYLWTQGFAAAQPRLLRAAPPLGEEQIDELAPGPDGTWAALERAAGNGGGSATVDVVSSRGGGAHVVTDGTIPHLVGDGAFLGYVAVTPAGAVDLYRIAGAHATRVATLAGVSAPQDVAAANGNLAVREQDGTVAVFTLLGRPLAAIPARAASVALTANRVVVRTRDRHLVVYGLRGGLVHDWKLAAASWTAGLAAYGRYAVYLGANKAVHAVRLADGRDRIVARAGTGWFFDGLSLQAPGAVVPLTARHGSAFTTTLRFLPAATLAKALA
jgi:hypothetical protein